MSKPVCLVTGPVATRSGYGAHSRDIVRALVEFEKYEVKVWNVRWGNTPMNALDISDDNDKMIIDRLLQTPNLPQQPDIHIHIVIPNEFQPVAKYNIGITAGLETTACPAVWIEGLNRMDVNFVPSNFVKEVVISSVTSLKLVDKSLEECSDDETPIEVLDLDERVEIFSAVMELCASEEERAEWKFFPRPIEESTDDQQSTGD